jgi:class 3 adenylate cyclase
VDVFKKFSETISQYHGITHEIRGDALLAEFARASDAVTAAIEFQKSHRIELDELGMIFVRKFELVLRWGKLSLPIIR